MAIHSADQLSAYLDGELSEQERAEVESSLAENVSLRREVDLINGVRSTLKTRANRLRIAAPETLEQSIKLALQEVVFQSPSVVPKVSFVQKFVQLVSRPLIAIPTALALALVVTLSVMVVQRGARPNPAFEVSSASYRNYQSVVRGDLTTEIESSDIPTLRKYFRDQGVTYQVFFPQIQAQLVGALVSKEGAKSYAHLVYKAGSHLVYLLEVDETSLADGSVAIDEAVAGDVALSRWHWEEKEGIGTLFVWKSNSIMCSAVSDLPTQEFSALFSLETL